jgi:hypothetical protein
MEPISRTKPPRGGLWLYTHPVSGTKFKSHQLDAIKYSIRKHEEANGYTLTSETEIESQLCVNHPFACSDDPGHASPRKLHLSDIVRGTRVLASFKLQGSPLVSPEEAERRASICVTCHQNVSYSKPCSGICQELIDLVQSVVGGAATRFDHQLKACGICGCANVAQIHVPADILAKGVTPEMMTEFRTVGNCWKWREIDAV